VNNTRPDTPTESPLAHSDLAVAVAAARLGALLAGFRGLAPTAKRRGRCAANFITAEHDDYTDNSPVGG